VELGEGMDGGVAVGEARRPSFVGGILNGGGRPEPLRGSFGEGDHINGGLETPLIKDGLGLF